MSKKQAAAIPSLDDFLNSVPSLDLDSFSFNDGAGGTAYEFEEPSADKSKDPDTDLTPLQKQELNNSVKVKKTISRQKMRRILSENNPEKELPWHFEQGVTYHCMSWGDVDSLTYFRAVVKQQHIKYALISTWCMAMEDCREIEAWLRNRYIDRIDFYCGEIFRGSYTAEYETLVAIEKEFGGRLCIFRNHSKIMVLLGDRFDCVIESSANVNTNPRTEQSVITVDTELARWYKEIFDGIISFDRSFDEVKPYDC